MDQERKLLEDEKVFETFPEDGFIPERKLRPHSLDPKTARSHFCGRSTTRSSTSRDPRVNKVILTWLTRGLAAAGILALLTGQALLGLIFLVFTVFCCKKSMEQVENRAKQENVSLDMTREEVETIQKELVNEARQQGKQVFRGTFTQSAMEAFERKAFPAYIAISGILVLMFSFASKIMAILALILTIGGGFLYHAFLKFLVKKSQSL